MWLFVVKSYPLTVFIVSYVYAHFNIKYVYTFHKYFPDNLYAFGRKNVYAHIDIMCIHMYNIDSSNEQTKQPPISKTKGKVNTMKKNINEIMAELAEYEALKAELTATISGLQDEVKEYMTETGVDEVLTADGHKATWREVVSNRFDTTTFKKKLPEVYAAYIKKTSSKRFTFNA